jgi:hypothetical protein
VLELAHLPDVVRLLATCVRFHEIGAPVLLDRWWAVLTSVDGAGILSASKRCMHTVVAFKNIPRSLRNVPNSHSMRS